MRCPTSASKDRSLRRGATGGRRLAELACLGAFGLGGYGGGGGGQGRAGGFGGGGRRLFPSRATNTKRGRGADSMSTPSGTSRSLPDARRIARWRRVSARVRSRSEVAVRIPLQAWLISNIAAAFGGERGRFRLDDPAQLLDRAQDGGAVGLGGLPGEHVAVEQVPALLGGRRVDAGGGSCAASAGMPARTVGSPPLVAERIFKLAPPRSPRVGRDAAARRYPSA